MSQMREEELIALAAEGDEEAFEEVVNAYYAPLFAFFYRTVMEREQAENLVQETFLRIHRYSGSYDPSRRARSWIFGIASNLLKDWKVRRPGRLESPTAVLENPQGNAGPSPEDEALRMDTRRSVARALMGLSEKHRMVFVLKHFHGLRYDEIAAAMDTTVGTVKSRMHYACRELRSKLQEPSERDGDTDE